MTIAIIQFFRRILVFIVISIRSVIGSLNARNDNSNMKIFIFLLIVFRKG